MTILIADDIATNRKLARASLKSVDCNFVEVTNGRDALDYLLNTTDPVVGLIDWEMPEIDGVEVCRLARERLHPPPLFLVLVTVRDNQQDIVKGLQQGASDYVTKPFDYAELLARVNIGIQIVALQQSLTRQAEELREALKQIKILTGILPICSYCSKIRNDKNHWKKLDQHVSRHSEASFSHGICPDCYRQEIIPMLNQLKSESPNTGQ